VDLTTRYVSDSRRVTAEIDNANITNPDHSRTALTVLITRATETLRTLTDHTERLAEKEGRLAQEVDTMRSRIAALETENGRLRREAA
jgi:FtsZ-binding cell division protein ZapB